MVILELGELLPSEDLKSMIAGAPSLAAWLSPPKASSSAAPSTPEALLLAVRFWGCLPGKGCPLLPCGAPPPPPGFFTGAEGVEVTPPPPTCLQEDRNGRSVLSMASGEVISG